MKNIFRIFICVCLGYTAISCHKEILYVLTYELSNQSGHTISIVHNPGSEVRRDSLVLNNKEKFYLIKGDAFEFEEYDGVRKIYYDGRYMIPYDKLPEERKFKVMNYTQTRHSYYVFTFTESDYDYAVAHGTDLGEPKPAPEQ